MDAATGYQLGFVLGYVLAIILTIWFVVIGFGLLAVVIYYLGRLTPNSSARRGWS
jgi:uncharacterized membrane protein (Fun14 family)